MIDINFILILCFVWITLFIILKTWNDRSIFVFEILKGWSYIAGAHMNSLYPDVEEFMSRPAAERNKIIEKYQNIFWSYDKMMYHFWIWDAGKMINDVDRFNEIVKWYVEHYPHRPRPNI